MYSTLKKTVKNYLINLPGWRTSRKIVVIESDDWGSIRMPSQEVYASLLSKGIRVDRSDYDRLDCLEQRVDLERLFSILEKHVDCKGNHPVFTFNTVMGNPDFATIKESGFSEYVHEPFFESYKKYYGDDLKHLWQEGIVKGLLMPQFHAREHLNVVLWMRDLLANNEATRLAFEHGFFGLKTQTSSPNQNNYLAAYYAENNADLAAITTVLESGLLQFESVFGFKSETFIACNYVWSKEIERVLHKQGVQNIQGNSTQKQPVLNKQGKLQLKRHYTGEKNTYGQYYTVRNVKFEPFLNQNFDWVSSALEEVELSFRCHKPALIATHRVNYVSGLSERNATDSNLKLDLLLQSILKRWPDVEFLSSSQLSTIMRKEHGNT